MSDRLRPCLLSARFVSRLRSVGTRLGHPWRRQEPPPGRLGRLPHPLQALSFTPGAVAYFVCCPSRPSLVHPAPPALWLWAPAFSGRLCGLLRQIAHSPGLRPPPGRGHKPGPSQLHHRNGRAARQGGQGPEGPPRLHPQRLGQRAGQLGRSLISDLLDAGADITTVQHLAGHAIEQPTAHFDRHRVLVKQKAARCCTCPMSALPTSHPYPARTDAVGLIPLVN